MCLPIRASQAALGQAAFDQFDRGLNGEIELRTEVVGIFPNDDAIVRLVGALLLEQNDEWVVQRARCMTLKSAACPPWHADLPGPMPESAAINAISYTTP